MTAIIISDKNKDEFVLHLMKVFYRERSHELYVPKSDEQKRIFELAITTFKSN